ncbi:hypothetical protein BASA81_005472 [Batrachochytrium salamandrivorans]|nr:hypothetical protein BASA81_005472 [Batrachochytrium salamandrivorans]
MSRGAPPPAIPAMPMTPIDLVGSQDFSQSAPVAPISDQVIDPLAFPPPVVDKLPAPTRRSNPGPMERCDGEVQRVLRIDTFDGAKVELQKVLGPNFVTAHTMYMGSSQHEKGAFYTFATTLVLNDALLIGRLDNSQRVEAQWHQPYFGALSRFSHRFQGQISPTEGMQGMLDIERKGDTNTMGVKLGLGLFGASLFQSVTPRLALGAEAMHIQRLGKTVFTARGRYTDNNHTAVATVSTGSGTASVAFLRRVSNRVGLAAELEVAAANLNSHMHVGAEFTMRQAKFTANVTSTGVLQATLQDVVGPNCFLLLSGMVDHRNDLYRFGVGVQLG